MTQEQIEQAAREYIDNLVNSRDNSTCPIHQKRLSAHFDAYDLEDCACNLVEILLSKQWISVDEELPPYNQDVFVRYVFHEDEIGYCARWRTQDDTVLTDKNGFSIIGDMKITHWMPIPKIVDEK